MLSERKASGTFRGLELNKQLCYNIKFAQPTPIQRKVLPLLLEKRSLVGIARTGSGKTLCYLLPAIQRAIDGDKVLILVPTKELAYQVKRIYKRLVYKIELKGRVEISTLKDCKTDDVSMLVVDEIDRVIEEKSLREHFVKISENFNGQRAYFSATLPDEPLNIPIVQIEMKIPESIRHTFLYVPSESKEAALLDIIDRHRKTIIFTATRYGVDLVLAVLEKFGHKACGIYGNMDDDARAENFRSFCSGKTKILVVTDVAARGLDIPFLDVSISYDMCDEKTFVHRVGRVRGVGDQISLVTYTDVFHFFNIKETHLPDVEIGTIPQDVLDRYDLKDFEGLKYTAQRGYQKCLAFRRKVSVPSSYKFLIDNFKIHSRYSKGEDLAAQIKRLKAREVKIEKEVENEDYKDQFYIPYGRSERKTHTSAFSAAFRDDYIKMRNEKDIRYRRYTSPSPTATRIENKKGK